MTVRGPMRRPRRASIRRPSWPRSSSAAAALGAVRVQWSTVEPHGFRTTPAKNGATSEFYSNVSTEPKTFGRWLGFDHIDTFERVVVPWGAPARIAAAVTSGEDGAQQLPG